MIHGINSDTIPTNRRNSLNDKSKSDLLKSQYQILISDNCKILTHNSIYDVVATCFGIDRNLQHDTDSNFTNRSNALKQNTARFGCFHMPITKSTVDLAITVYILTVGVEHAFNLNKTSNYEEFNIRNFLVFIEKYTNGKVTPNSIEKYCQNIQKHNDPSTGLVSIKCNRYTFEVDNLLDNMLDIFYINAVKCNINSPVECKEEAPLVYPELMAKNFIHVISIIQRRDIAKNQQQQQDIATKLSFAIELGQSLLNKISGYEIGDKDLLSDLSILILNCNCQPSSPGYQLAYTQIMRIFSAILTAVKFADQTRLANSTSKIDLLKQYGTMYKMFDTLAKAYSQDYYADVAVTEKIALYQEVCSIFENLYADDKHRPILSDIGFMLYNQQLKLLRHNLDIVEKLGISVIKMEERFMNYANTAINEGRLFASDIFLHINPFVFISKGYIPKHLINTKEFIDIIMQDNLEEENVCMVYKNFEVETNKIIIQLYNQSTIVRLIEQDHTIKNPFTRGALVFLTIDDLKKYEANKMVIEVENDKRTT